MLGLQIWFAFRDSRFHKSNSCIMTFLVSSSNWTTVFPSGSIIGSTVIIPSPTSKMLVLSSRKLCFDITATIKTFNSISRRKPSCTYQLEEWVSRSSEQHGKPPSWMEVKKRFCHCSLCLQETPKASRFQVLVYSLQSLFWLWLLQFSFYLWKLSHKAEQWFLNFLKVLHNQKFWFISPNEP